MQQLQPEAESAVAGLLAKAGARVSAEFRATWDLDDRARLRDDSDPLRRVMLARWTEACVLLFARGLGCNGEMDEVAAEEATLEAWCAAQQAAARDGSETQQPRVDGAPEAELSAAQRAAAGDGSETAEAAIGGVPEAELDAAFKELLGVPALFCLPFLLSAVALLILLVLLSHCPSQRTPRHAVRCFAVVLELMAAVKDLFGEPSQSRTLVGAQLWPSLLQT